MTKYVTFLSPSMYMNAEMWIDQASAFRDTQDWKKANHSATEALK